MRTLGLTLSLLSIITVFFHFPLGVFIFGAALVVWGVDNLKRRQKLYFYIYLASGFLFMAGVWLVEGKI
ncbi:hypothetical protein FIU87_02945 [Bacillus sp. THAF10]|uniref:hypothetical protein n=1 Tax=Bacillus sp. THAF10 TaxID=2587848 RepID=UPI001268EF4D|nr:hypothetical protein [Bacillus sp. THAF10]QFT87597.1 hypothetical protein FIU87_02945 [Bacillus sp. THAF10]